MAEDNDLEKRAIEELLRETDRARVRAETMGPAGWLKCPLKSTNKRFLLNTLRSTGLQRRSSDSRSSESATRGRLRSESPERRRRDRSRSPHRDHGRNRGHKDKHYHEDSSSRKHKRREKGEDRHDRHTRETKHERSNEGHKKERHK